MMFHNNLFNISKSQPLNWNKIIALWTKKWSCYSYFLFPSNRFPHQRWFKINMDFGVACSVLVHDINSVVRHKNETNWITGTSNQKEESTRISKHLSIVSKTIQGQCPSLRSRCNFINMKCIYFTFQCQNQSNVSILFFITFGNFSFWEKRQEALPKTGRIEKVHTLRHIWSTFQLFPFSKRIRI